MSIEIKRWTDGEVIYVAEDARNVREAVEVARADSADLRGADLYGADLYGANLYGANLHGANLHAADLHGADLRGARGIHPARITPLHILNDQVGKIRAYKLVNADGEGPCKGGIVYEPGKTVECPDANTDPDSRCGAGINVATLDWCLANHREGCRVLLVEFSARDIAAIPTTGDGKFRLRKCRVVREVDLEPIFAAERDPEEETADA